MKTTMQNFLQLIDGKVLTDTTNLTEIEITDGYVSDLLSDVMGNANDGSVWITIMRHLNVIAVASLASLSSVVFSKNILPEQAVINKANEEGVCLVSSPLSTFEIAGKLYDLLNKN